jgi:hypothetical protein
MNDRDVMSVKDWRVYRETLKQLAANVITIREGLTRQKLEWDCHKALAADVPKRLQEIDSTRDKDVQKVACGVSATCCCQGQQATASERK